MILLNWFNCLDLPYNLRCDTRAPHTELSEASPEDQLQSLLFPPACFLPKCDWTHLFHYHFFFPSLVCLPISHLNFCLFSFLSFLFGSLPFLSRVMFAVTAQGQPCPTSRFHLPEEDSKIYEILNNESRPPSPAARTVDSPALSLTSSLGPAASRALFPGRKGFCRILKPCSLRKLGTRIVWSLPEIE